MQVVAREDLQGVSVTECQLPGIKFLHYFTNGCGVELLRATATAASCCNWSMLFYNDAAGW